MVPADTIGAVCDGSLSGNEYAQTLVTRETFLAVICLRGEWRVPARSWSTYNQSPPSGLVTAPWAEAVAYDMPKTTANATRMVETEATPSFSERQRTSLAS